MKHARYNIYNVTNVIKVFVCFGLSILLLACQADIDFSVTQKVDRNGKDYATLAWNIRAVDNLIPTKVVLGPGFGEVDFVDQVNVYPKQSTTYTLTIYAKYKAGGISNSVIKRRVYVGPRVNYELFTDTQLRECAQKTGFTHIQQFVALVCSEKNIQSLQGISQLKDLKVATLDLNNISNLSPLAGLNQLNTLSVSNNKLDSLSSLPYLPALTSLVAFNNQITDVSPLAENPQLLNLAVNNNTIKDLSSFTVLTNLNSLSLANNLIEDISPLSQLNKLRALNAKNNRIRYGVRDLSQLKEALFINLQNNPRMKCLDVARLVLALGGKAVLVNGCSPF